MLSERSLSGALAAVRSARTPDAIVLDAERDFETLSPEGLSELREYVEGPTPHPAEADWLPEEAPELLGVLVGPDPVVGMPGDGAVAWTPRTDPPVVIVKGRTEGSPAAFMEFLLAEALVELGVDLPEHFLDFFGSDFPEFVEGLGADPATAYQIAVAVCEAYRGHHTRPVFEGWAGEHESLHDAWLDAGDRLDERLDGLAVEVAGGQTAFADAAELACAGVKHGLDVPTPFSPLGSAAFEEYGASFAVKWAEKL